MGVFFLCLFILCPLEGAGEKALRKNLDIHVNYFLKWFWTLWTSSSWLKIFQVSPRNFIKSSDLGGKYIHIYFQLKYSMKLYCTVHENVHQPPVFDFHYYVVAAEFPFVSRVFTVYWAQCTKFSDGFLSAWLFFFIFLGDFLWGFIHTYSQAAFCPIIILPHTKLP